MASSGQAMNDAVYANRPAPPPPQKPIYLNIGPKRGPMPPAAAPQPVISQPVQPRGPVSTAAYVPPETNALKQIGQIDPTTVGTANKLGSTYNTLVNGLGGIGDTLSSKYNDLLTKDPMGYAANYQQANAGQLPPGVMREIQQDVRGGQAARGNDNGVAQAAAEAMTTGAAGYNYLNQARNNYASYLQGVMGQAGGYLGNTTAATQNYLGSPTTPYAMGSNYVDRALNQQTAAATGAMAPSYNPYASQAPPFSYLNPNAGSEFGQGTRGFMAQGVGATPGSPDTSGQLIGAGIGAAGAIGSSAAIFAGTSAGAALLCQVAREVYGADSDKYVKFRDWVLFKAPAWFRKLYARFAWPISQWIKDKPVAKWILGKAMGLAT